MGSPVLVAVLVALLVAAASAAPLGVKTPALLHREFTFSAVSNDKNQLLFSGATSLSEPTDAVYTVDIASGNIERLTRTHGKQSVLNYANNEPGRRIHSGMYISTAPSQVVPAIRKFEPVVMFGGSLAARPDPRTFYCQINDLWMYTYEEGYTPLYRTKAPLDRSSGCRPFTVTGAVLASAAGTEDPENAPPAMDPTATWYDTQNNLVWIAGGAVCEDTDGTLAQRNCTLERNVWRFNVTSGMWAYFANAALDTHRVGVDPEDPGVPFRYFHGAEVLRYCTKKKILVPTQSTTPEVPLPVSDVERNSWHSVPGSTHVLRREYPQTACTIKFATGKLYGIACAPINAVGIMLQRTYFGFAVDATTMRILSIRQAAPTCRPDQVTIPDLEVVLPPVAVPEAPRQEQQQQEAAPEQEEEQVTVEDDQAAVIEDEPVAEVPQQEAPTTAEEELIIGNTIVTEEPMDDETADEVVTEEPADGEPIAETETETEPTDVVPETQITNGGSIAQVILHVESANLTLIPRGRGGGAAEGITLSPGAVAAIAVSGIIAVVLVITIGTLIWSCTSGARPRNQQQQSGWNSKSKMR